jgi:hypothetical protein
MKMDSLRIPETPADAFNDLEFRCHSLGHIAFAPPTLKKDGTPSMKGGQLTKGNLTFLRKLFTEVTTGRRKEVTSKYFEKGNFMEEDGITMVNAYLYPNEFLKKNTTRKRNGWIEGECDLKVPEIVYDIKNAWDIFTFGEAELNDIYEWQGRGYMWLENVDRFRLFYCLNNMPEHMLINEEKKMFYREGRFLSMEDPEYLELCEELRANHNYDHIPSEERFKVFEIERDKSKEDDLKQFITKSREYLNFLLRERQDQISFNRHLMGKPSVFVAGHDKEVDATIVTQMFDHFKPAT